MSKKSPILRLFFKQGLYFLIFMIATPLILSRLNLYLSSNFQNYKLSLFAFSFPVFFFLDILLIIFLLLTRRYKMITIPVIALLLTWGIALRVFAIGGLTQTEYSGTQTIRVLTWNVAMQGVYSDHPDQSALQDSIIQTIVDQSPDVICMQEFVAKDVDTADAVHNLFDIVERLDMPHFFYGFVAGVTVARNHFGKIILSKYPIVFEKHVMFDSIKYNNSFEYVDILKGDDTIRVATFHLESLSLTGKAREITTNPSKLGNTDTLYTYSKDIYGQILNKYGNRVVQASAINELIQSSDMPIIVCGDMNDVPSSYAYSIFRESVDDAFLKSGTGLGRTYDTWIPSLRIDYIFYSPSTFTSHDTRVLKVPYSDHFPVVTELHY